MILLFPPHFSPESRWWHSKRKEYLYEQAEAAADAPPKMDAAADVQSLLENVMNGANVDKAPRDFQHIWTVEGATLNKPSNQRGSCRLGAVPKFFSHVSMMFLFKWAQKVGL